ncbi:MAG: hypothetical protein H6667_26020 [Ardenticatenaceae bacterium]|nr:hypothetical protein [Ardenticatenaceae bacterium]
MARPIINDYGLPNADTFARARIMCSRSGRAGAGMLPVTDHHTSVDSVLSVYATRMSGCLIAGD